MFNRFLSHIESKNLIPGGTKVLLACSGGIDSSVLFHLLLKAGVPFSVAHVDHLTREGDSTADAAFVEKLCREYNVPFHLYHLESGEAHGVNFQAFAHDQRYRFFQSLSYDLILTAHHQDDILESIFLNFIQGRSLGGIYEQLGNVVRPLLPFSRDEISEYAFENDIPYIEDYSNMDTRYDRNYLRNEILPLLKSRFDNISKRVIGLSDTYATHQKLIKELLQVSKNADGRYRIAKSILNQSEVPSTLLYSSIQAFGFSRGQSEEVIKSLNSVGTQFHSSTHILTIDREELILDEKQRTPAIIAFDYQDQNHIEFGTYRFSFQIVDQVKHLKEKQFAYFPISKLNSTLILRTWQAGDSFKPYGMDGHTQSLKKFFTDQKIDTQLKQELPLLINRNDIIWITFHRTHDDYAISETDGPFLKVFCEQRN